MSTANEKILKEALALKVIHEEGVKKAMTIIKMIQGEVSTSPAGQRRREVAASLVAKRNLRIQIATSKS